MECDKRCKRKSNAISGDAYESVTEISSDDGNFIMTSYQVLPGIKLVYNDIHTQSYKTDIVFSDNIIEINHCREGRMECRFDDKFCYITPGDLMISTGGDNHNIYFPLNHYHGISVLIDIDIVPRCLSCFLDDVKVCPQMLAKKFLSEESFFVARSNSSVEHIFSELYFVPSEIKKGYLKLKVLELLLFLSVFDIKNNESTKRAFSKNQVELAKKVSEYLIANMDSKITLDRLSEHFHVSGTHIKNTFKGVYGVSLYAYIRTLKMESAAYMLEYSDKSILEIAGEHGYDNGSKFAGAFKEIKGKTPSEYRRFCKSK